MSYPTHPNKEPPFPEISPCPWCGREGFRHDLTKHINPALGVPSHPISDERALK